MNLSDVSVGMTGLQFRTALNANNGLLENGLDHVCSVKDYGAVGDGVTDDYTAITAALNACKLTGKTLIFPAGVYKVNTAIVITGIDIDFKIVGVGDVTIDGSDIPGSNYTNIITLIGAVSDGVAVTANISKGVNSITSALSVVAGDLISVESDKAIILGNNYYGEMFFVKDVADGVIETYNFPIYDYDVEADTVIAKKINSHSTNVDNIKFIGNTDYAQGGLKIQYGRNCNVSRVITQKCYYTGVLYDFVFGGALFTNSMSDCDYDGLGYGIAISSCNYINIFANKIYGARHCITTGGTYQSKHIKITDNYLENRNDNLYCIGIHEGDIFIDILNNTMYGTGVNPKCRNVRIEGNNIFLTAAGQQGVLALSNTFQDPLDYLIVRNNVIKRADGILTGDNNYGILINFQEADTIGNILISGNIIEDMSYGIAFLSATEAAASVYNEINIFDNSINCATLSIFCNDADVTLKNVRIKEGTYSPGMSFGNAAIETLEIHNASILHELATGKAINITAAITNCFVSGNNIDYGATGDSFDLYDNITNLYFINNLVQNTSTNKIQIDTVTNAVTFGNIYKNCAGNIINTASNKQEGTDYVVA
jgi:hypothetical protein